MVGGEATRQPSGRHHARPNIGTRHPRRGGRRPRRRRSGPRDRTAPRQPGVADAPGSGKSVVDWNRQLITILGTPGAQPATIHPTRSFAILQAAEYDAVVSITKATPPYKAAVPAAADARPDVAADQAAHDVLAALYPSTRAGADDLLRTELAAVPDGEAKQDGIAVGQAAAAQLLTLRASDGATATPAPFPTGTQPGDYRPTPPKLAAPMYPNWGSVAPFVLSSGSQFRPAAHPAVDGAAYASALAEVETLGRDVQHHPQRGPDRGGQVLERLADLEHLEPGGPAARG